MNHSQPYSNFCLVLDNIRSCYNVGSILRSMDFFGFSSLIVIGNTPYPRIENDTRPTYISNLNHKQIAKTALGAEHNVKVQYYQSNKTFYDSLSPQDKLISLEQDPKSISLDKISFPLTKNKIYIVLGSEDKGVSPYLLDKSNQIVEIMGYGTKESLNVSSSAAIVIAYISMQIGQSL